MFAILYYYICGACILRSRRSHCVSKPTPFMNIQQQNTLDQLKNMKGQRYVYSNIRSLFGHLSEMQADFENTNFTVIGLSETWLKPNLLSSMVYIEGYKSVKLDQKLEKIRGGGVMFYIRKAYTWDLIPNLSLISNEHIEILTIILHKKFCKDECISVIYILPNADKKIAIGKFYKNADVVFNNGHDRTFGGDFKIDLNKSNCTIKKHLDHFARKNALQQLIKKIE